MDGRQYEINYNRVENHNFNILLKYTSCSYRQEIANEVFKVVGKGILSCLTKISYSINLLKTLEIPVFSSFSLELFSCFDSIGRPNRKPKQNFAEKGTW